MKKRKFLSIMATVIIGMVFTASSATATENTDTTVDYETFCKEIAEVLKENHIGNISIENTNEYLKDAGIFENINSMNGGNEMRLLDAKAMLINSISEDKDKIMQLGKYPNSYAIVYKILFGENEEDRNISSNSLLTRTKADEILRLAKRYVCDYQRTTAYESIKESNIFEPEEYSDEKYNRPLTRGEAAILIADIVSDNIAEMSYDPFSNFSDVDVNTATANSICALRRLGVFNGYEDGTFRPDESISLLEFYKSCICAARLDRYGYGEYPDRYTALMTYFDLCGGMGNKTEFFEKLDTPANYGQALQIVYNIWLDNENAMFIGLNK